MTQKATAEPKGHLIFLHDDGIYFDNNVRMGEKSSMTLRFLALIP